MSLLSADCSGCGYHRDLSEDTLRTYKLSDQSDLRVPIAYGWCEGCSNVTAVEALPSLERIDAEAVVAAKQCEFSSEVDPGPQVRQWSLEGAEHQRKYLQELRRWRVTRTGPAKCLDCGSTRFEMFAPNLQFEEQLHEAMLKEDEDDESGPDEWLPLFHPGCGGSLKLQLVGLGHDRRWIFYTPEGDKIGDYEVFFHRGLVPRPDET